MKSLINILVTLALLAGATYYFAPGIWVKVQEFYREQAGWTEQAKQERPVAYLEYVIAQAEREFASIDEYALNYNHAIVDLRARRDDSRVIVGHDDQLLEEMRELYHQVQEGDNRWPVQFRDAAYTEPQFKQQVEVLLNERATHENIVQRLSREIGNMHDRLSDLKAAKADYKAQLAEMRANLAIARATQGTRAIDDIITNADRVMSFVDETSTAFSSPVRTATEMGLGKEDAKSVSGAEVDTFLSR